MNPLYQQMQTSVFERMSALAAQHGAVNLGQGFPDFGWPDEILDVAAKALTTGSNQYPPSRGIMPLREAVAAHYHRHFGQPSDARAGVRDERCDRGARRRHSGDRAARR